MGAMTSSPTSGPWRCPRCGSERDAADAFCGRCATRRPAAAAAAVGVEKGRSSNFPVRRALILNGIILSTVVVAVLFSRNEGPGAIVFEPGRWLCDGSERAWVAAIPATHEDLLIEWRSGGPEGALRTGSTASRTALEAYRQADGAFRVTTTETAEPECRLPPDRYTLVLRDATSNVLVATGDVELGR